jgi:hypothetical protein
VLAVMAAVSSNMPLSIFDNAMFKTYLRRLDSKHRTLYHLERTRIIEVLMDGAMQELLSRMMDKDLCQPRPQSWIAGPQQLG